MIGRKKGPTFIGSSLKKKKTKKTKTTKKPKPNKNSERLY